ncbi:MAG: hypothetical protein N2645_04465 [Clostridia bacterium]|nr:hypothetical protein [Clostridia bacterium]
MKTTNKKKDDHKIKMEKIRQIEYLFMVQSNLHEADRRVLIGEKEKLLKAVKLPK